MNIQAATGLMDIMKSNLGPKGTLKMIVGGAVIFLISFSSFLFLLLYYFIIITFSFLIIVFFIYNLELRKIILVLNKKKEIFS